MNFASMTTAIPPWLLFLFAFAVGIGASELGSWITRRKAKEEKEKATPVGTLVGALLGLLAFMLGFTFSITASRFSERKHLVVNQSNAIATCYFRTSLLPEKQRRETQRLFKEYIDILVTARYSPDIQKNAAVLEALQMQIWYQASSLQKEDMDSPLRSLYVSSVNKVIDIFAERKAVVLTFKIPGLIWLALLMLYILSMFVVGAEMGFNKSRRTLNVPIMAVAFAMIVVLIAEMDASNRINQFKVNQQPLIDIQKMITSEQSKSIQQ
jgi:hypothetical protein